MRKVLEHIKLYLEFIRCFPHLLVFLLHKNKVVIEQDIQRWLIVLDKPRTIKVGLIYLLGFYPEFRNLFYKRVGVAGNILNIFCGKLSSLYIVTNNIGPGLFIQHGFATIIAAKSIGSNCWINQQVTIGYGINNACPVIEDNVSIKAGAKLFNNITIGSNSIIGANAVVGKNVPPNCTVVGVPAYIVKMDGEKLKKDL